MPYFPTRQESAYRCEGCGDWFIPSNVSCCVAHAPGTCCHVTETRVVGMGGLRPRDFDFNAKSEPGVYAVAIEGADGRFLRVETIGKR
jgi:hypothetical protein